MKSSISAAQAIAYEAASHELGRLLDDAAYLLWRTQGEESLIGRLADEARWSAFMLHDRIALHAVREAGAHQHQLAIQPLAPIDQVWRSPNRFQAEPAERGSHEMVAGGELTAAISTCKAVVVGMSVGYAGRSGRAHALTAALRSAEQAIDALHTELEKAAPASGPGAGPTVVPEAWRRHAGPRQRAERTLLLLRGGRLGTSPSVGAGDPAAKRGLGVVPRAGREA